MTEQQIEQIVQNKINAELPKIKRKWFLIGGISAFLIPITIWAASINKPHTFVDGDTLSASKLNENFDALFTKINALGNQIVTNTGFTTSYTNTETSIATVTGTFTGQPVLLIAVWSQASNAARNAAARFRLDAVAGTLVASIGTSTTNGINTSAALTTVYTPTAGAHTFFFTLQNQSDGVAISAGDVQLYAIEMPLR